MKMNRENFLVGDFAPCTGFTPWTVSRLLHASAFVVSSVSLSVSCFGCRKTWIVDECKNVETHRMEYRVKKRLLEKKLLEKKKCGIVGQGEGDAVAVDKKNSLKIDELGQDLLDVN